MTAPAPVDIGAYLARSYPDPPCWALGADVYVRELGLEVEEFGVFKTVSPSVRQIASALRVALTKGAHGFVQIDAPQQWCIVLLGRSPKLGLHHCGVWLDGAVLHARESGIGGVVHEDLSTVRDKYRLVEYWARSEHVAAPEVSS